MTEPRSGDTFVEEVPPEEAGPVPVHVIDTTPAARLRDSPVGRVTSAAVRQLREFVGAASDVVRARSAAEARLLGLRADLKQVAAERERALRDLGAAVYGGDDQATEAIRARIAALDASIERTEQEMQTIVSETSDRVERASAGVPQTQMIEPPSQPNIPEPYPPPGELDPPTPPEIPEPYPPPGEADPPAPPQIPEPYPPSEPE